MRSVAGTGGLGLLVAAALTSARPAPAQLMSEGGPSPIQSTLGALMENSFRPGGVDLVRLPLTWSLSQGQPRRLLLDIEPSFGWHVVNGATTTSGLSYTRFRVYYLVPLAGPFSIGPDVETYLKTESDSSLGFGYNRIMPGIQGAWFSHNGWRVTLRTRYEFSGGEDPGVKSLGRVVVRPSVYPPNLGRWSLWGRTDIAFDVHGGPSQYNAEGYVGFRPDAHRRLTVFMEPRVYIGYAARTSNLWRLRSGVTWSLGELVSHHPEGN